VPQVVEPQRRRGYYMAVPKKVLQGRLLFRVRSPSMQFFLPESSAFCFCAWAIVFFDWHPCTSSSTCTRSPQAQESPLWCLTTVNLVKASPSFLGLFQLLYPPLREERFHLFRQVGGMRHPAPNPLEALVLVISGCCSHLISCLGVDG
jgi:hypothetical protein